MPSVRYEVIELVEGKRWQLVEITKLKQTKVEMKRGVAEFYNDDELPNAVCEMLNEEMKYKDEVANYPST